MKLAKNIIILFFLFIITYILQTNIFTNLTIAGIKPNLFIIFTVLVGIYVTQKNGVAVGLIVGIIVDALNEPVIGVTAISLGIVGYMAGLFERIFSTESKITIIIMVIFGTLLGEILQYVIQLIINQSQLEIVQFIKILSIEALYNGLLTIIVYPIYNKMHQKKTENEINTSKLSRYL